MGYKKIISSRKKNKKKIITVTGGTGFIGVELVKFLKKKKYKVLTLDRVKKKKSDSIFWELGENLSDECKNVECLIHLACNNLSKKTNSNYLDIDFLGTKIILNNIKKFRKNGQKIKFIFLSSQSSSKNSLNLYGKSKFRIEKLMNFKDDIIIRPGLVYSNKKKSRSIFDNLNKISKLPILPTLKSEKNISTINILDLAKSIERIITFNKNLKVYKIAYKKNYNFKELIEIICHKNNTGKPIFIKIPNFFILFTASLIDFFSMNKFLLNERIKGLINLKKMNINKSLKKIKINYEKIN